MNSLFNEFMLNVSMTGDIETDFYHFLLVNGHQKTAEHCLKVGEKAEQLAKIYGVDPYKAKIAGYLHDVSAIFPNSKRIVVAKALGLEVLKEEEFFPMIIHQKISGVMAAEIFDVHDDEIISAIACHTTLKSNASKIDKVLFVADKIEWDQDGVPPYIKRIEHSLKESIDAASYAYIKYLFDNKNNLKVVHPFLESAYKELKEQFKE
ncbi:bis(5'-nucleosyl)-tetraphosphatase (symmetrical) YqeK [Paenibacillus motobuensis]|uniref:bis(5'-nucleosyl)-tetraphosphatase (symmetrical) YqeK n=1 Tax=Paenibacillus TaxID=44249 RepID=UPI00203F835E|nr:MULTISPECIES: bis(5'-nucleosyl)-tetraphosphatase (symmetrical) YqeK [Paenibacillus]MCM3040636.1 bis(5'-nucleosyl)-tetraphosphatase (symmetrical) YqeK [Paenibacillus lutimineralis]MCM3647740.1 bis(5'-nucleosyl)-tetraphosphatase (symmetrical) YqeK [Paenibacillus motobuensis]